MSHTSAKLSYCHLKPYMVEKKVEPILYYLKLLSVLYRLHLVFLVIKIIATSYNPIPGKQLSPLDLVIIYRKEK